MPMLAQPELASTVDILIRVSIVLGAGLLLSLGARSSRIAGFGSRVTVSKRSGRSQTFASSARDVEEIDLRDTTILPGLIDCHSHLLMNYSKQMGDDANMLLTVAQLGTTRRALLGVAMAREDLEAGFTTVRDLGSSGVNGDVALREAIQAGWVVGPRVVASSRALSANGGQFGNLVPEAQKLIEQEYAAISGAEEA